MSTITKGSDIKEHIKKEKRKRDMQYYLITFVSMLIFTCIAFLAVYLQKHISHYLIAIIIVTMAIVQVAFQLYYFMHMKDKDHGFPALFLYGGALVAFLTVLTFLSIVWIS
ncbi:cytochrome C oxidase subunit IV family protein [Camelliibacillus cellulosilyticus]|uniref:Cytochrome C oxidase subunit IV family protein n=1 Tax=Camelliibacillus cellulosilyticus TaxID=2174486 RepID=A0ABV9GGW1_9BACL